MLENVLYFAAGAGTVSLILFVFALIRVAAPTDTERDWDDWDQGYRQAFDDLDQAVSIGNSGRDR